LYVIHKTVIVTEIIAPYRIPVFNALAQRPEIDLHVVFLSENDPTLRQWRVYKDEIRFDYDVLPSWRQRFGRYNLLVNWGIHSALNRTKPDVVLCGGYNYLASWAAAYWARIHRVPLLLWSESTAFDLRRRYRVVEFMKTQFLRLCTGFVVPGRSSSNYLKDLGIGEQRIFTAPNAVDTSLFSKFAEVARRDESQVRSRHHLPERYFLYVGRLVKAKGVFDLLDAYARLKAEHRGKVGLVFVGDGSDRQELVERASKIVPGTIQFLGFMHREELPAAYALADGLIFPTHSDPWGLVVNEAMACGLPVIATNVAGCASDLVENGWNGFVISPGDASQLSLAMEKLASNSELRVEMGRRSRERVEAYAPAAWAEGMVGAVRFASAPLQ
jgi:glycosyltransferase involved in cell wall biosynthesis